MNCSFIIDRRLYPIVLLTLAAAAPAPLLAVVPMRTVALSGQHAAGTPAGVNYSNFFSIPVLNGAGRTAFVATLTGAGVDPTNGTGLWSEGGGVLALVVRAGSPAPGTPAGVNYSGFDDPRLDSAGRAAFRAFLTGAGVDFTNDVGIWSEGGGVLALVAREGSPAPGTPAGVNYNAFNDPLLNSAGRTAFSANLTGAGVDATNDRGIWSEGGGVLELVAREGSPAPGTGAGVNYIFVGFPVINGAGRTAFRSGLTGVGVDETNRSGIWSEGAGALALVARTGEPAPGTGAGVNYSAIDSPVLNDAGSTAFWARLTGAGVDATNNTGIWLEGGPGAPGLTLVVRAGSPAPGTGAGVNFSEIGSPVLNGAGRTAFVATLIGAGVDETNDRGIWSEGGGVLALVAREGEPAPGTGAGVNYSELYSPVLNGAGRTAFQCTLTGAGVTAGVNDVAIFAEVGAGGSVALIARTGESLEVAPGDVRTPYILTLYDGDSGLEDGRPAGFNDAGQVAFRAVFTDETSGVFKFPRKVVELAEPLAE